MELGALGLQDRGFILVSLATFRRGFECAVKLTHRAGEIPVVKGLATCGEASLAWTSVRAAAKRRQRDVRAATCKIKRFSLVKR